MAFTSNAAALAAFTQINSAGGGDTSAGPITGRFGSGNVRIIPVSGTFTPVFTGPHEVRLWGGGNAGYGGSSSGGGGGGFAYGVFTLTSGVGVTVTVAGSSDEPTVGGGTTSFGALLSATGGVAGSAVGGVGVGGIFQAAGGAGGGSVSGGGGAGSLFGPGGSGDLGGSTLPAQPKGSGGGAGANFARGGTAGLTGVPGGVAASFNGTTVGVYVHSAYANAITPIDYFGTGSGGASTTSTFSALSLIHI